MGKNETWYALEAVKTRLQKTKVHEPQDSDYHVGFNYGIECAGIVVEEIQRNYCDHKQLVHPTNEKVPAGSLLYLSNDPNTVLTAQEVERRKLEELAQQYQETFGKDFRAEDTTATGTKDQTSA